MTRILRIGLPVPATALDTVGVVLVSCLRSGELLVIRGSVDQFFSFRFLFRRTYL